MYRYASVAGCKHYICIHMRINAPKRSTCGYTSYYLIHIGLYYLHHQKECYFCGTLGILAN